MFNIILYMIFKNSENEIKKLIKDGVIFIKPETNLIGNNVKIEPGVIIYPYVQINDNVTIKKGCKILSFAIIENNININNNVFIGQYSLIRENVNIGAETMIGPHCEIVRSNLGVRCKIGHKNFIGDATLMDEVYFGAGAIIANTNWKQSYKILIGEKTKIGANATIISPNEIGENCFISAGAIINKRIPSNTFVKFSGALEIRKNKY